MDPLTLTYSLADQNFYRTKSIGIFNVSTQLLENLVRGYRFTRLTVLGNSSFDSNLQLPQEIAVQCHNEAAGGRLSRILWDQCGVYRAAKNSGNQWLFLPKGFASFLKPRDFKLAVYVHDTIHDFYRVNYPGAMPLFEIKYFTQCLIHTLKYSRVVFTNSDFTKEELKRLADNHRIDLPAIITAGIGFTPSKEKVATERNSLLVLTSTWPHKLTERAVNFIERWQKQTGFSGPVKLIGSMPKGVPLPHLANWQYHSRVCEAKYRQFLSEAKVLLFFSAYEGFGMPPVEATIEGVCPVFSDLPVTREVMRDKGFSFSNDSYESFFHSLDKAINVSETQVRLWSQQLLQQHNWKKVVAEIANGLIEADKIR